MNPEENLDNLMEICLKEKQFEIMEKA